MPTTSWTETLYRLCQLVLALSWGILAASVLHLAEHIGWSVSTTRSRLMGIWFRHVAKALSLQVEVIGQPHQISRMVVANHISWLDIVVLGSCVEGRFLAKQEVRSWPMLGWLAGQAGTLFIDRQSNSSLSKMVTAVADEIACGRRVLLFPEGTTSVGEQVMPFHSGLFEAAKSTQSSIQPAALEYFCKDGRRDLKVAPFVGKDEFSTHLWRLLRGRGLRVRLSLLTAIPTKNSHRRELATIANQRIAGIIRSNVILARTPTGKQRGFVGRA